MSQRLRLRMVAVVTSLMLTSVACSGSESASDKVRTTAELAGALLETKDLDGVWKLNKGPAGADFSTTGIIDDKNRDKLPQVELCDKTSQRARDALKKIHWQAFRQLDRTVDNPLNPPKDREGHMEFVQQYLASADPGEFTSLFDDVADGFRSCLGDVPAGEEGPGTISEAKIKKVGDQRVAAYARIGEAGGVGTWNIYSVFVRSGSVLMSVMVVDIVLGKLEPELTLADVDSMVAAALEKV